MKTPDLGQTIGLVANLGILVGILLLAYELAQNREMMQSQTRTAIAEGATDFLVAIYSDEHLASLWVRGNAGEELSEVERIRHDGLRAAVNRYYENAHYQYRTGLYEEGEFAAQREQWRILFSAKGIADHWCRSRAAYSPEYAAEINGLLTTYQCE